MIKRDYYEVLGLERSADNGDIKKAYRQLALKFHPDRNREDPRAEERFKEASEAYQVLSDPQRRQIYDTYGHQGLAGTGFQGFSGMEDIFSSFGDLFEDFFGGLGFSAGTRSRRRSYAGADLRHDITISFLESATGAEKEITVTKEVKCEKCGGDGIKPGSKLKRCETCQGSGQMTHRQGFFILQTTCPHCRGQGSVIEEHCPECKGRGRVEKKKKLSVKIPAGIEDGMNLVLRGEGQAGVNQGPPGDLFVQVSVEKHEFFERHGDDLWMKVPISFIQAALGGKIEVETLEGEKEKIEIPQGTETGDEVKIPHKGFTNIHRRHKGDQVIFFIVKVPKKLTKKQRQLLEEFSKE